MSFLDDMASSSRQRLEEARRRRPLAMLRDLLSGMERPQPLTPPPFLVFAEVKRNSPALGRLEHTGAPSIGERLRAYTRGGAGIISVLTEPSRFGGSLDDLTEATRSTMLPVMRKDFLIDPYQVAEARAAGASGVLCIVRMLDDQQLADMVHAATELGMFVLLESFDEQDAERAVREGTRYRNVLYGVNVRDLTTLKVHPEKFAQLRSSLPRELPAIAESGIASAHDAAAVAELGYHGALVGGALMKAADPESLCRQIVDAGAAARSIA